MLAFLLYALLKPLQSPLYSQMLFLIFNVDNSVEEFFVEGEIQVALLRIKAVAYPSLLFNVLIIIIILLHLYSFYFILLRVLHTLQLAV